MTTCISQDVDLRRGDRIFISWSAIGIPDDAEVFISMEGGPWSLIDVGVDEVIGYFAGPLYVNPGAAKVVPVTSFTQIRVITNETTETFDTGFIKLVP